jgi:hypothetical protein
MTAGKTHVHSPAFGSDVVDPGRVALSRLSDTRTFGGWSFECFVFLC